MSTGSGPRASSSSESAASIPSCARNALTTTCRTGAWRTALTKSRSLNPEIRPVGSSIMRACDRSRRAPRRTKNRPRAASSPSSGELPREVGATAAPAVRFASRRSAARSCSVPEPPLPVEPLVPGSPARAGSPARGSAGSSGHSARARGSARPRGSAAAARSRGAGSACGAGSARRRRRCRRCRRCPPCRRFRFPRRGGFAARYRTCVRKSRDRILRTRGIDAQRKVAAARFVRPVDLHEGAVRRNAAGRATAVALVVLRAGLERAHQLVREIAAAALEGGSSLREHRRSGQDVALGRVGVRSHACPADHRRNYRWCFR